MANDEKTNAAGVTASTPQGQQPVTVNIVQPDKAGDAARAITEGRALNMDTGPVGGRYLVNGILVNADGEPLKDADKDK